MFSIILMIANYFHDLAVGLLAANILVIYYLGRILDKNDKAPDYIPEIFKKLSRVTYWVLGYIILGGALRAFFFMDYEWNPAVGKGQVSALIVKHIILFSITAWGLTTQIRYIKKYGKK